MKSEIEAWELGYNTIMQRYTLISNVLAHKNIVGHLKVMTKNIV